MQAHANLRLPSYVPPGYSLWTVIQGTDAGGFGFIDSEEQYAATYLRGKMPEANATALSIFRAPPGATTLAATTERVGEQVDLGVRTATAVYHDGMWLSGPGDEQRIVKWWVLHWNRATFHSLTVKDSPLIWGIRGPKTSGIDKSELMRIAASLLG